MPSHRADQAAAPPAYAELHCLSNFTFLRGASHPHELMERAEALGYTALALTDECSVAGVVRAHMAAKNRSIRLIVGAEFRLTCGLKLAALATSRRGYGRLCRLITRARRAADKGEYTLTRADLAEFRLTCGLKLAALATSRRGYGRLCRLITRARRAADKGEYTLTRADLE